MNTPKKNNYSLKRTPKRKIQTALDLLKNSDLGIEAICRAAQLDRRQVKLIISQHAKDIPAWTERTKGRLERQIESAMDQLEKKVEEISPDSLHRTISTLIDKRQALAGEPSSISRVETKSALTHLSLISIIQNLPGGNERG
jgi:hypothetical protein